MKTDARVRYTKMRIKEAFCDCLKEKPINKITVTELCERAEINRATFYTHYLDPFDLLDQLERECLERIGRMIDEKQDEGVMLLTILNGVQQPQGMAALLSSQNGDPAFASKITALYRESYMPWLAKKLPNASDKEREQIYRFLAGGCGSLIALWIEDDMQMPAEEMAQRMQTLCSRYVELCAKGAIR